ncbi:MAG: DUF1127 domain-containing protein [Alphaproteobacteria bacterium]
MIQVCLSQNYSSSIAFSLARVAPLRAARRAFWRCLERARHRRALGELDQRLLADIGVTELQARVECAKPVWRP